MPAGMWFVRIISRRSEVVDSPEIRAKFIQHFAGIQKQNIYGAAWVVQRESWSSV